MCCARNECDTILFCLPFYCVYLNENLNVTKCRVVDCIDLNIILCVAATPTVVFYLFLLIKCAHLNEERTTPNLWSGLIELL